jgi:transcriptional regulator with XRE-family HTH domain
VSRSQRPVAPGWKRPYLRAVGLRLQEVREARGLSREELAALVGSTRGHVRKLEEGLHAPRPDMVARLADALGVSARELDPR